MLHHCLDCERIPIGSTRLCQERARGMGEDYGHSHGHLANVYLHIIFFNLISQVIFYFLTPPSQFEISEHASGLCIFLFAFTRYHAVRDDDYSHLYEYYRDAFQRKLTCGCSGVKAFVLYYNK